MRVAALKTQRNAASVDEFVAAVDDEVRRADCLAVMDIMATVTKEAPQMWGSSIIGFGNYDYRYASGRQGSWFLVGLSPRKRNLTLYIMSGFAEYDEVLEKLGKFKTGKSCLYINRLDDVHVPTLKQLVRKSVGYMRKKYG